jgi:hypothetical protein
MIDGNSTAQPSTPSGVLLGDYSTKCDHIISGISTATYPFPLSGTATLWTKATNVISTFGVTGCGTANQFLASQAFIAGKAFGALPAPTGISFVLDAATQLSWNPAASCSYAGTGVTASATVYGSLTKLAQVSSNLTLPSGSIRVSVQGGRTVFAGN